MELTIYQELELSDARKNVSTAKKGMALLACFLVTVLLLAACHPEYSLQVVAAVLFVVVPLSVIFASEYRRCIQVIKELGRED